MTVIAKILRGAVFGLGLLIVLAGGRALAANTNALTWHKNTGRVDANVRKVPLPKLLEQVASASGWNVLVEPNTDYTSSTAFKDLPVSEALRMLLGNLNFAVVPQSNAPARLYVFRTSLNQATQLIQAGLAGKDQKPTLRIVPNELIVRLKPGAKIEELAAKLGATVVGKIDALNAYRLRFDDADAANAARNTLASNTEVASVDSNYILDQPQMPQGLLASSTPPLSLQPKAPPSSGRIVIGLVDTPIQSLGKALDAFIQKPISVAGEAALPSDQPTHATSMAQTMLTSLQTVTSGGTSVQILPVDVYGNNATTTTFDVALGVTAAVNAGANPINLSLGTSADSEVLHETIRLARAQGVVFFASAGNEAVTTRTLPAAWKEVAAVTAGNADHTIAAWANYGSFVSIVAPGTAIVYYKDQPFVSTGTSTASAYASGMAAGISEVKKVPLSEAQTALQQKLAPVGLGK